MNRAVVTARLEGPAELLRRAAPGEATAGAGGGTSLRNMLAGELPYAELATSAAIAGSLAGVELKMLASSSNHIGELTWAAKPDAGIASLIQDGYLSGYHLYTLPKYDPTTAASFYLMEPQRWGRSL